ncbi:MAG: phosphoenolpyruvate--protein phosphotransferase [Anaerolineales bacterium]|jgi:phosphoenolpyruvate-protein phosphotransferase
MKVMRGTPASAGIAIGPAFQFKVSEVHVRREQAHDPSAEMKGLEAALKEARQELTAVLEKAQKETDRQTASIFEAHAMMLEDPDYLAGIENKIHAEGLKAEGAVAEETERYAQLLEGMEDEYLRARAADVRDVGMRIVRILLNVPRSPTQGLDRPSILLARDLTPSDTVSLDKSMVLGFCTVEGGPTAHVAILARQLGLPAVVGIGPGILDLPDLCPLLLDGSEGTLTVEPEEEISAAKRAQASRLDSKAHEARKRARDPATTRDGHRVEVAANIGNVASAATALEAGAEGVGLLRTEFLYLERTSMPDEEEQYQAYRAILDTFDPLPVILRTLDVGGDKQLPYLDMPGEMNPFLGLRAIRLCLAKPELFKPQLRAVLRAGARGHLRLMFPMVATVAEVRAGRRVLEECRAELAAEGAAIAEKLEVGIMVEIPAAAVMADQLAAEVDFFSIGTNDLSQYTLAADRTSSSVSSLADAFQPSVLRLVRQVVQAAHREGKWAGMCGEIAGEPLATPLLLGLGLDELSMNPTVIPQVKQILRGLSLEETQRMAPALLDMEGPEAVRDWLAKNYPV